MKRFIMLILVLTLLPVAVTGEEEEWTWQESWEYEGIFESCEAIGHTAVVRDGITALGSPWPYHWDPELEEYVPNEEQYEEGPSLYNLNDTGYFDTILFPDSLRYLWAESIMFGYYQSLTLPKQLEALDENALYDCRIDVLRVETTLPPDDIRSVLTDNWIKAFEVPDGHPLYKSVDGVLFSRDGKTLLAYPNDRQDTHYDVPAGVERIGRDAITNEYLKTVSLPIGLKAVEDYAFFGCTRLQSIAFPLTVREFGENIFDYCVSLELVSLPAGVEMEKPENDGDAVYYTGDVIYRGDNGDTCFVEGEY